MIEATRERAGKWMWPCLLTLALFAWLIPLEAHGQSAGRAPAAVEPQNGHEHASAAPHDHDHEHPTAENEDRDAHGDQGSTPQHPADESASDADQDHESGHDHDHDHDDTESGGLPGRLVSYLGKFHPPMVNFPIAMLIGSALAEVLFMITGRGLFANAARYCIWIGVLGALTAALLGWCFGGFQLSDTRWVLTVHRWLGTTTAAWSILVLVLSERVHRVRNASRTAYRCVLFVGAALVSVTGFFGGALIYGINHYAW
jgi:uncharacterized membrane protein